MVRPTWVPLRRRRAICGRAPKCGFTCLGGVASSVFPLSPSASGLASLLCVNRITWHSHNCFELNYKKFFCSCAFYLLQRKKTHASLRPWPEAPFWELSSAKAVCVYFWNHDSRNLQGQTKGEEWGVAPWWGTQALGAGPWSSFYFLFITFS